MEEKNTSFRFDFGGVISAASGEQVQPAGHTTAAVVPAKEVIVPVGTYNSAGHDSISVADGLTMVKGSVSSMQAATLLSQENVAHSDLISGAYEGGFKLWECSVDLAAWLWMHAKHAVQEQTSGPIPCEPTASRHTKQKRQRAAAESSSRPAKQAAAVHQAAPHPPVLSSAAQQQQQQQQQQATQAQPELLCKDDQQHHRRQGSCPTEDTGQAPAQLDKLGSVGSALRSKMEGLSSCRVLELGCGHGLPGITAALLGAEVHFQDAQDYNEEVLTQLTAPNLHANLAARSGSPSPGARYFAGDWQALIDVFREAGLLHSYDLILAAETIYSESSFGAMTALLQQGLKPDGLALVAAKTHYFGVGGGVQVYKDYLAKQGTFSVQTIKVFDDGRSNHREVFCMQLLQTEAQCKDQ